MSDRRKRQHKKFPGEKESLLRLHRLLEVVGGPRVKGYDLDLRDLEREDPPPEPEPEKIRSEEDSQPPQEPEPEPEQIHWEEDLQQSQEEPEPIQGEEKQGSSQPPPPSTPPSEQAKVRCFPSSWGEWATFPREQDNPSNWITDEYGEWRSRYDWIVPPYYRTPDPEAPKYFGEMLTWYQQAASRLPIAQMPDLAGVLSRGGLLLGFNDPVTNIIVNAIYFMGRVSDFGVLPPGTDPVRHAAAAESYVDIARRSRAALVVFMVFYFRHLTEAQAKRYLSKANHDLALAIRLVEQDRSIHIDEVSTDWNRTKIAVRYAAGAAMMQPDPDDLVRLLSSRFPRHLLDPVLEVLRAEGKPLSVSHVNDILNLLRHPWSPPLPPLPAPNPGTFRDANGNVTIIVNIGHNLFSTTTITRDHAAAFNNEGEGNGYLVTTTTISRHPSHGIDNDFADTAYLNRLPNTMLRYEPSRHYMTPDVNSLMMCLLDNVHGLYIKALAMVPACHVRRLLHAVMAAGHCYGIMEKPEHNIIINSIWYILHYLPPDDETVLLHHTLHHTRSMTRIVSCSLHGLIAFILAISRDDHSRDAHCRLYTEEDAVYFLYKHNCFVRSELWTGEPIILRSAALAAKHPNPDGLVTSMERLYSRRDVLATLMTENFSDRTYLDLFRIVACFSKAPPDSDLCQPTLIVPGCWAQAVREKLEELLLNFARKYPLGPNYMLVNICGVASKIFSSYGRDKTCYHANFLAINGDATEQLGSSLFFAEFWDQADGDLEQSERPPFCCPVPDIQYHCRCFICESDGIRLVHPNVANYFMGRVVPTDTLCAAAVCEAALVGTKLEFKNRV